MKTNLLLLSVLLLLPAVYACNNKNQKATTGNTEAKDSIPPCLADKLRYFSTSDSSNVPVRVDEYLYKGKKVFLFTAPCCDQFNDLYDEDCKFICAPTGGIAGVGDRKCEDFSKESNLVKKIWEKGESTGK